MRRRVCVRWFAMKGLHLFFLLVRSNACLKVFFKRERATIKISKTFGVRADTDCNTKHHSQQWSPKENI